MTTQELAAALAGPRYRGPASLETTAPSLHAAPTDLNELLFAAALYRRATPRGLGA